MADYANANPPYKLFALTSIPVSDMVGVVIASRKCQAHERIEINPDIMDGKPVVRCTRIPVERVLRKLGAGRSPDAILADHPRLTRDDILAA